MRYILDSRYCLRGWYGAQTGIYDTRAHAARFVEPGLYGILLQCDAVHEIDGGALSEAERRFIAALEQEGSSESCGEGAGDGGRV